MAKSARLTAVARNNSAIWPSCGLQLVTGPEDRDAGKLHQSLHDLVGWNSLSTKVQERIKGRTKLSNIEPDDAVKRSFAHNELTTIVEDGKEINGGCSAIKRPPSVPWRFSCRP